MPTASFQLTPANNPADSNLVQAHEILENAGLHFDLVLVDSESTGSEGQIYLDLTARHIRATTGPDEGIDITPEECSPHCVFVPRSEINVMGVASWVSVLRHEYRHIIQATNNPNMARDFRDANGLFTSYGAFSEACADYGLNVEPAYHAQERIDALKAVVPAFPNLIDPACNGDKSTYDRLVVEYNQRQVSDNAFRELFPQYR